MKRNTVRRIQNAPVDHNDFLCHYGIAGQKWGIRRFQNEDGTLTEEGKKRYNQDSDGRNWKKEDAEKLSDDELNKRTNRLQREQNYRQLTTTKKEREEEARKAEAAKRRSDTFRKIFIGAAIGLAVKAMAKNYQNAFKFIGKFAKQKVAPYRLAFGLKNILKNKNIPDMAAPAKEILGKHVLRV